MEHDRPAVNHLCRADAAVECESLAARGDADSGRRTGPDRHRLADRPIRRARDVHCDLAGVDRAGAGRGSCREVRFLPAAVGVRVLPRDRGHGFCRRHPVRQRVVPGRPPWVCHRRVRHGHGGHRVVGVFHTTVRALVRPDQHSRHHRRCAGAHRCGVCAGHAQLAGLHTEHRPGAAEAGRRREAAGDLGDVVPVRHRVRWFRRVRQLPAHLYQVSRRSTVSPRSTQAPARPASRWLP